MTWGIVTYQQYFSGFFQLPFPEIPRFKRKEASANTALGAAMPRSLGRLVSLPGAVCMWPLLYKVVLKQHHWLQKSAVYVIEHPVFTDQSLLGCASLERAAQGGQQGKGAENGVALGVCMVVALLQAVAG